MKKKGAAKASTGKSAKAPLILIVDDFEDNREMYAEYLSYEGYRVALATNGQDALDQANEIAPDLIVMDLSLPVLDGWEATRRLKGNPATRHIPVLALTGHALAGHSKGAKEAGCNGFLAKPCLPQTLAEVVKQMLEPQTKAKTGSKGQEKGRGVR